MTMVSMGIDLSAREGPNVSLAFAPALKVQAARFAAKTASSAASPTPASRHPGTPESARTSAVTDGPGAKSRPHDTARAAPRTSFADERRRTGPSIHRDFLPPIYTQLSHSTQARLVG